MILLITSNQDFVNSICVSLSIPPGKLVHMTSFAEAEPHVAPATTDERPQLALIDASLKWDLVAECRPISTDVVPIIAIITDPAIRHEVFEAGAGDYLLYPLNVAEIKARLATHLNVPHNSVTVTCWPALFKPAEALAPRFSTLIPSSLN